MSGISEPSGVRVPGEIVQATLRAAQARGVPVADVPLRDIAQEAGISRSTLVRRLGGNRQALDEALRAAGVEVGGRKPVRERAIEVTGALISAEGLGRVTFERVAAAAECSVPALYAVFAGRDDLLRAVFDRYSPIVEVETFLAGSHEEFAETVHRVTRLMADALEREPRVLPSLLAEVFTRPGDADIAVLFESLTPRLLAGLGAWLAAEAEAGRVRDLPPLLLTQLMTAPLLLHLLLRPVAERSAAAALPGRDETIRTFAEAFLRAVALPAPPDPS
ncbi:TetR/AcrR family transcriptional regulator [Actinocorallia sp. A-T 12471]|uniref:TetR/AcrR family transcriptional regulator n=1 Tax=Actinocorallia sp. A-T 12471 TaxID=3089813 RepID=UPI0029CCAA21|nr:TetR/AcrR family transcriptional regulator [Actinocorallia sp. A-T 12471]MDX6739525.1 TetR/AcrR family transcriptional regulator [Actinocorallia sp. A-T 12471]